MQESGKDRKGPRLMSWAAIKLLVIGGFAGVIFWGGFNTVLEETNNMDFCISCHEMKENVYWEYRETLHFKNPSGVQATCADCHVPKTWVYKFVRKVQSVSEIYHKILGTIDTPEKFEEHRWRLANRVWNSMRATDSRECRNCHAFDTMDLSGQDRYARKRHERALERGETCIDCHTGIAHDEPEEPDEDDKVAAVEKE
jgi:nitrate/TMAO reductase-like tetraheme cytochrome c subunit